MKVLIILALCSAAYAFVPPVPVAPVNGTVPVNGSVPVPPKAVPERSGRYYILRDGAVYDRLYDYVIPTTAQLVYNRGSVGNRDVYISTIPLRTYRPAYEYVYV